MHLPFLQGGSHDHTASGDDAAHLESSAQLWGQKVLPDDLVSYIWRGRANIHITNRHAPRSQRFDASSKDCLVLGIYLRCLPMRLGQYEISVYRLVCAQIINLAQTLPLVGMMDAPASQSCYETSGPGNLYLE